MRLSPPRLLLGMLATALVAGAGCISEQPKGPLNNGGVAAGGAAAPPVAELPPDNPDALAAMEQAAYLTKDAAGRVTRVELKPSATNDALKHLAGLPGVQRLEANVRGISDEGLAHLKGHPSLRYINFEQSSITNAGMTALKDLPKLDDLFLKKSDITAEGYRTLAQIPTLKRIRAPQTRFDNDCLDAIKGMKQLEVLDLSDCNLVTEEKLIVLKEFPNLKFVRLWGQTINDNVVSFLAESKSLRALHLDQSIITEKGFDHIAKLTELQELSLSGVSSVTDASLSKIKGLTKLEKLDLRDDLRVTSLGMSYLAEMKSLKDLDLTNTIVANEGLEFLATLPNLETLNLWSTRIDDAGLAHLEKLPKLKWLKLDQCNVGDKGMKSVGKLTNLEYLHIGSTQVTDAGLKELHSLANLKELVLTFASGVTDNGVDELEKALPRLETIDR